MSTVPFGKYKGRPVEDMLADADYMGWLEAQPWFRERFQHLTRRDSEQLSRTPEHNRLQALFLDANYAGAFSQVACPKAWQRYSQYAVDQLNGDLLVCDERIAQLRDRSKDDSRNEAHRSWAKQALEKVKAWEAVKLSLADSHRRRTIGTRFEHDGADVFVECRVVRPALDRVQSTYDPVVVDTKDGFNLRVEIKPVVADDYPVVLRQMNRNKSSFLFLDSYEGQGATFAQFLKIFRSSDKAVVLKCAVDREVAEPST